MSISAQIPNMKHPLIAAAVAAILLAACAPAPVKPDGAAQARDMLTQLQSDPQLANRAPTAVHEAEVAVSLAEQPEADPQVGAYRVFMAERKVETARAEADTKFAEDQRVALSAQRERAQLDARTREADIANGQAATARAEGAQQKAQADTARSAADAAQAAAASSQQQAADLQQQLSDLQAKQTDRGLVLTLGDVLFATGRAELTSGADGHLNKLVAFLNKYPDRTVNIEGYTDSVGGQDYNLGLSQRRANSVESYLRNQGVGAERLVASGKGDASPVAGNDSASGRQQNRRVEVIINEPSALR